MSGSNLATPLCCQITQFQLDPRFRLLCCLLPYTRSNPNNTMSFQKLQQFLSLGQCSAVPQTGLCLASNLLRLQCLQRTLAYSFFAMLVGKKQLVIGWTVDTCLYYTITWDQLEKKMDLPSMNRKPWFWPVGLNGILHGLRTPNE